MARRGRRTRRAPFARVRRRGRVAVHRFGKRMGAIRGRTKAAFSRLPTWAKPSRILAVTGVASGVLQLVAIPLANGDSWISRLKTGYGYFQTSKNPFDLLAEDDAGNNALSIAALQLQQNAVGAAGTVVGFGLGAAFLSYFGM